MTAMAHAAPLTIADIPWLRLAAHRSGALRVPQSIAVKLLKGGFVRVDSVRDCLTITPRGELALSRLG